MSAVKVPTTTSDEASEILPLNIGGTVFITTRSILTAASTYWRRRLSGEMDPGYTADGALFVDRSGKLFAHVLEYMRNLDEWCPPVDSKLLLDLVTEAQFYGIDRLIANIKAVVRPYVSPFYIMLHKNKPGAETTGYASVTTSDAPNTVTAKVAELLANSSVDSSGQYNNAKYRKSTYVGVVAKYTFEFQKDYKLMPIDDNCISTVIYFVDRYSDDVAYNLLRKKLGLAYC